MTCFLLLPRSYPSLIIPHPFLEEFSGFFSSRFWRMCLALFCMRYSTRAYASPRPSLSFVFVPRSAVGIILSTLLDLISSPAVPPHYVAVGL